MILIPHEGARYLLKLLLKDSVSSGLVFKQRLFQNSFTPTRDSVLGDFVEATFASYAPVDLARANWTDPVDQGVGALSVYGTSVLTWTATSGTQTVYGSYVTDDAGTVALWCELFPQPIITGASVPVAVLPLLTLWSP